MATLPRGDRVGVPDVVRRRGFALVFGSALVLWRRSFAAMLRPAQGARRRGSGLAGAATEPRDDREIMLLTAKQFGSSLVLAAAVRRGHTEGILEADGFLVNACRRWYAAIAWSCPMPSGSAVPRWW